MRIALHFALLFALLAVALSAVAVYLVGHAVEDRIHEQLRDTVRLLEHVKLSDPAYEQLSRYIHAEIVVVNAAKKVEASSLRGLAPPDFEPLPAGKDVTIRGTERSLVAIAPLSQ